MKKAALVLTALIGFGTLFASSTASAQTVRGFIRATTDGIYLDVAADHAPYRLVAASEQTTADLQKLKVGDYLVARGTLDEGEQTAQIDCIESLGLRELIGPWQGGATRVYEFQDFSRLNLYQVEHAVDGMVLSKLKEMNYSVAPDAGGHYSIFMSDNSSVQIGFLDFQINSIRLTMVDPKTGEVTENISLSPLPVK